ncbi:MAG: nicotinate phosphoribosyltransferase, partial [Deltaproteobacteria bacterium]
MNPRFRDPVTKKPLDKIELFDDDRDLELGTVDGEIALRGLRCGNHTLDTDLYELTMVAGYLVSSKRKQRACFDLYYRQNPDGGGFCVFSGLESVIQYVSSLRIFPDDLDYLRSLGIFSTE